MTIPAVPPRARSRRGVIATTLLAATIVTGLAGTAISQVAPPSDAGPDHPPAQAGNPMRGPHGHPPGPRFGGPTFGPGSAERFVEHLVRATDATGEQKQKMTVIAVAAAQDVLALREQHLAGRRLMLGALTAPTVDRVRLESLRAEQMKLLDDISRRVATALADIAEVLSPAQRAELNRVIERRLGR
jgi:protein CpxP